MIHPVGAFEEILSTTPQPEVTLLDIPAQQKYLETVSACLQAVLERVEGLDSAGEQVFSVKLAVHEACANIIEHAYRFAEGRIKIQITLYHQPRSVVIDLFDTGAQAALDRVRPPNLEEPQVKGYGLFLMQQLMDSVEYLPEANGNHWRLEKKL